MAVAMSGQRPTDVPASGVPTVASARPRLGPALAAPRGDAREGLRDLARVHVGRDLEPRARRRPRAAGARRRRRRSGLHPGRGPRRVGPAGSRHGRRPRHHGRPLPDQPGCRGRLPDVRLRCRRAPRRGPGTGRQGPDDGQRGGTAHDHLPRAAWAARLRRRSTHVVDGLPRARSRAPGQPRRRRRAAHGRRRARRRDDARLHLRHDRPPEGRDAHQRQRGVHDGHHRQPGRTAAERQGPRTVGPHRHLPPAVPRRRAGLLDLAPRAVRGGPQLRRVDRHDHDEPQRDPADAVLRRAADLGEDPRRCADPRPRRDVVQAHDARLQPQASPARSAGPASPTAATTRSAAASGMPSPSRWPFGR